MILWDTLVIRRREEQTLLTQVETRGSTSGQASSRKPTGFQLASSSYMWLSQKKGFIFSRTVYIQHIIRMSFPHYVGSLTAVCTIICFVQVIDEQVGPRQYGVLRHFIIDSHPSYHHRPEEEGGEQEVTLLFPTKVSTSNFSPMH